MGAGSGGGTINLELGVKTLLFQGAPWDVWHAKLMVISATLNKLMQTDFVVIRNKAYIPEINSIDSLIRETSGADMNLKTSTFANGMTGTGYIAKLENQVDSLVKSFWAAAGLLSERLLTRISRL